MVCIRIVIAISILLALALPACAREDLLTDASWEYRADDGPWAGRMPAVPAGVEWPRKWVTFSPWPTGAADRSGDDHPSNIAAVPTGITLNGISACRATLGLYARGVLDLTVGQAAPRQALWAYAFADLKCDADQDATIDVRSCAALTLWLDGKQLLAAKEAGEHSVDTRLSKGNHILAARIDSGPGQWQMHGRIRPTGGPRRIDARCEFELTEPAELLALAWTATCADCATLNGRPVPLALPGMNCEQAVIPASALAAGRNVLVHTLPAHVARATPPGGRLLAMRAQDAAVIWGPVVSHADPTSLTIVCRTNAPVEAVLDIDGRTLRSAPAFVHRWQVKDLRPGRAYEYTVQPGRGAARTHTVRTLPAAGPATIALVGDPQSGTAWRDVARAAGAQRPDYLVILGDLVADGLSEEAWTRTFFSPGADLLACVPVAVLQGNHDRRSPVFAHFFGHEAAGGNWTQQVGDALLVGIDGALDWSPDGEHARWLEKTLAETTAPFVFVLSHYPAYSSRNHGKLAADGRVLERPSRVAREQILPILQKHKVTAMLAGHDHGYERSELPDGLTLITAAGGGAGFYARLADAEKANPHSRVFLQKHHVGLLKVDGDTAVFSAVATDGQVIDTRTWKALER